jgi:hypothetical protein
VTYEERRGKETDGKRQGAERKKCRARQGRDIGKKHRRQTEGERDKTEGSIQRRRIRGKETTGGGDRWERTEGRTIGEATRGRDIGVEIENQRRTRRQRER